MQDDDSYSVQLLEEHTALRRLLFRDASAAQSGIDVVNWWESRRVVFNSAVGVTGIVSLLVANLFSLLGPGGSFFAPPFIAIIFYGFLANFFFTGGWIAELMLRPVFGRRTPIVGSALFRYGFAFSIGVTLLPAVASGIALLFRIVKAGVL